MAASLTLIFIGVMMLTGGEWGAGYPIACIAVGAAWWHASEHARRRRLAAKAAAPPGAGRKRNFIPAAAAALEIVGMLTASGSAFDHPEQGLFNGFSAAALLGGLAGVALLLLAAQVNSVSPTVLSALLRTRRAGVR